MKVWVVYIIDRDEYTHSGDVEEYKGVCKIFDSEEKAVNYIRERIKLDHEGMENCELNFNRSQYVRFELDQQEIAEGHSIGSYQYYNETVSYHYVSYEVE